MRRGFQWITQKTLIGTFNFKDASPTVTALSEPDKIYVITYNMIIFLTKNRATELTIKLYIKFKIKTNLIFFL